MAGDRNPRILISRLSAIGDCVLTLPVVCALRDRFPNAYLAWAVGRAAAPLLEGHAALDELIVLDRDWLKSPRSILNARRKLRERNFDVCLDPQSLTKSSLIGRLAGAPLRIGLGGEHGCELSPWLNNKLVCPKAPHVVDRSLELLRPLGIDSPNVRFDLPNYPEADRQVSVFLDSASFSDTFAVINVGASWPSKLWLPERFAKVAQHLARHHDLPSVIVWAGDHEYTLAQTVIAGCPTYTVLAPPTTLCELASLQRRARLLISADTGPLHLGAAAGTPCVGLYGPTRPEVCGPYGRQHMALQAYYQDGGRRERRRAENAAMRAISVADACHACEQVLSRFRSDVDRPRNANAA